MKITKIEVQKNNKNRVNIYVDDDFFCGLSLETVLKNGIKQGFDINIERLEYLKNETEKEIALNKAIGYISKSAKTKKQIKDYLTKKGFEDLVVDYVINKLIEYNFINDEEFSKSFVKYKSKNNGKRKILLELKLKGVSEEVAKESVENFSNDKESVVYVAEKYLKNKPLDLENKQKLYRHLLSKGFEMDDIMSCLNKIYKE